MVLQVIFKYLATSQFEYSIYDLSISSNVNIHIFLIWQKPLQFFWNMHTLLYTRKYENSIFALQLNWLQHRQSCSHEREGTKRKNKIKRNSIYIVNEIYLHMSSNLHCNLGNGQNEFLCLYSNKSWNSSYDFFVAFLLCIGIIKSSSF